MPRISVGASRPRAGQGSARVFESRFDRLAFFFALASVAVWTYVLNEWWGGGLWRLLLAIAAAIPVGLVFSILPSVLLRTLSRLPLVNDALLTWLSVVGGIALGVYALIAFEGTTLAMVTLTGAEIFVGGVERFYTRLKWDALRGGAGRASALMPEWWRLRS